VLHDLVEVLVAQEAFGELFRDFAEAECGAALHVFAIIVEHVEELAQSAINGQLHLIRIDALQKRAEGPEAGGPGLVVLVVEVTAHELDDLVVDAVAGNGAYIVEGEVGLPPDIVIGVLLAALHEAHVH
jgi:hypothetical protein